jgi:hypothetical protein
MLLCFFTQIGACEVFTGYLLLGRRLGGEWTNEYVTLDKRFYNLIFKEEVVAAPVTATSRRPLFEI